MSLYPFHDATEIAAFTRPQRAAFDLEVWRPFRVPVVLERGGRGVYRDTVGLGLRGAP